MMHLGGYRKAKGIRRPEGFCMKPPLWFGQIYSGYRRVLRTGGAGVFPPLFFTTQRNPLDFYARDTSGAAREPKEPSHT
jgi:hypothetical protein